MEHQKDNVRRVIVQESKKRFERPLSVVLKRSSSDTSLHQKDWNKPHQNKSLEELVEVHCEMIERNKKESSNRTRPVPAPRKRVQPVKHFHDQPREDLDNYLNNTYISTSKDKEYYKATNEHHSGLTKPRNISTADFVLSDSDSINEGCEDESLCLKLKDVIKHLKSTEEQHLKRLEDIIPIFRLCLKLCTKLESKEISKIDKNLNDLLTYQSKFTKYLCNFSSLDLILYTFIENSYLFNLYHQFLSGSCTLLTITVEETKIDVYEQITLGQILNKRLINYKMYIEDIKKKLAGHKFYYKMVSYILDILSTVLNSLNTKLMVLNIEPNPLSPHIIEKLKKSFSYASPEEALALGDELQRSTWHEDFTQKPLHFLDKKIRDEGYAAYDQLGNYLLKDEFRVKMSKSSPKVKMFVYLFEKIIIFRLSSDGQGENNTDLNPNCVGLHEIRLLPLEDRKVIRLEHYTKSKMVNKHVIYSLIASSEDVASDWYSKIEKILVKQQLAIKRKVTFRKKE